MNLLHAHLNLARLLLRAAHTADDHGIALVISAHVLIRAEVGHVRMGDGQLAAVEGNGAAQTLAHVVDDVAQVFLLQRLVELASAGRL